MREFILDFREFIFSGASLAISIDFWAGPVFFAMVVLAVVVILIFDHWLEIQDWR